METLTIFEAGMRSPDGSYSKFIESPNRSEVARYLELMSECKAEGFQLVFYEKTYHCVSTTTHVVGL